jgi:hypothetical protein
MTKFYVGQKVISVSTHPQIGYITEIKDFETRRNSIISVKCTDNIIRFYFEHQLKAYGINYGT